MWLDLISRVMRGKANGQNGLDRAVRMSELQSRDEAAAAEACLRTLAEAKERNARFKSAATRCLKKGKHA
jgi:hypothetical protein